MQNMQIEFPTFDKVSTFLSTIGANLDAAKTHGILCAFICCGNIMDGKCWLAPILEAQALEVGQEGDHRSILMELYEASWQKLQSMEFDFKLLLPDEESPLSMRAHALSQWCLGFILGLEMAGLNREEGVSEDVDEFFQHLEEIAELDHQHLSADASDEPAYTEVIEYVRIGILMVYNDMANQYHKSGHGGRLH
jgi:uncharacterized protein YgfB (UPF0149 family)